MFKKDRVFALLVLLFKEEKKKGTTKLARHVLLFLHARDKQRPKKILLHMKHLVWINNLLTNLLTTHMKRGLCIVSWQYLWKQVNKLSPSVNDSKWSSVSKEAVSSVFWHTPSWAVLWWGNGVCWHFPLTVHQLAESRHRRCQPPESCSVKVNWDGAAFSQLQPPALLPHLYFTWAVGQMLGKILWAVQIL